MNLNHFFLPKGMTFTSAILKKSSYLMAYAKLPEINLIEYGHKASMNKSILTFSLYSNSTSSVFPDTINRDNNINRVIYFIYFIFCFSCYKNIAFLLCNNILLNIFEIIKKKKKCNDKIGYGILLNF